jgi:hypothetical protein
MICLPSFIIRPQQIFHDSVLKPCLIRSYFEEFHSVIYLLPVKSWRVFFPEGISQLIPCSKSGRLGELYGMKETTVEMSVCTQNIVTGRHWRRHNGYYPVPYFETKSEAGNGFG